MRRRRLPRWSDPVLGPAAVLLGAGLIGMVVLLSTGTQVATSIGLAGLAVAVGVVPFEVARLASDRKAYREQGWRLANALEAERHAVRHEAETAERARIAGEVHDSLGHDMAMLAMRCASLEVRVRAGEQPVGLPELAELREAAAAATERLHEVVALLDPDPDRNGRTTGEVRAVVDAARAAGLPVVDDLDDGDLAAMSSDGRLVVRRVLEETLTNAAKHAPGHDVRVSAVRRGERLVVEVVDRSPGRRDADQRPDQRPETALTAGGGRGLHSLTERVRVHGGRLGHGPTSEGYAVRAEIPVDARARPLPPVDRGPAARPQPPRATRVVVVPAVVVLVTTAVLALSFVAVTVGSVLPPDRYARLSVGQPEAEAERLLPPFTLPDAPASVPDPAADCRSYEASVSFFARVEVFQVCFADRRVVALRSLTPAEAR